MFAKHWWVVLAFFIGGCSGEQYTTLMQASRFGDTDGVVKIIAQGANVNEKSRLGKTPLILAASAGHDKTVAALIERGADLEAKDSTGATALIATASASEDYGAVMHALLERGANVNAKDNDGATALYIAVYFGHPSDVAELLNLKHKLSNEDIAEALLLASALGHLNIVKDMLWRNIDVNTKGLHDRTALHAAIMFKQIEITRFLVANGAKLDTPDDEGKTPLNLAQDKGNKEIIELLKQHQSAPPGPGAYEKSSS